MPYSQFGLGFSDLPYTVPTVNRMGGVAYTVSGSNYINPFNPASYGSIGMESFVFDMGANIQLTRLQNNAEHANDADGNISHLMFGLPITKWWKAAAGLLPYSTVDYESVWESTYLGNSVVKNIYDGTGGVSMVFVGSAFNILGDNGRRGAVCRWDSTSTTSPAASSRPSPTTSRASTAPTTWTSAA